jgi:3-oxoacyl-[acyl-carrier protein] reductase
VGEQGLLFLDVKSDVSRASMPTEYPRKDYNAVGSWRHVRRSLFIQRPTPGLTPTTTIDVKTVEALRLIRETIHLIPHDGTGRIINVAGGSGIAVWSPALLHGINNAALLHMTGFLAADLAAKKVTVNAIVPGLVGTEFRQIWAKELGERQGKSTEEFVCEFCKSKGILLERWAEVSEIGDLVVFLASDRASYITGAKIPIDGGFSINSR